MRACFDTFDALEIAKVLLEEYEPPICVFIKEDDFKKLKNKEEVEAINSFTRDWTIDELRQKKVLFVSYSKRIDVLAIEHNWERFMGNRNVVFLKFGKERK